MKIERVYLNSNDSISSRTKGYYFNVVDDLQTYHYEFVLNDKDAEIITDHPVYLEDVVKFFRLYNVKVENFHCRKYQYYRHFDPVFLFYLPISILQVSKLYLNEEILKTLEEYHQDNFYFPVTILHDEYVLLSGHHLLYVAYQNDRKMVQVYMESIPPYLEDIVYFTKEQNVKHIQDMKLINEKDYSQWIHELNIVLNQY